MLSCSVYTYICDHALCILAYRIINPKALLSWEFVDILYIQSLYPKFSWVTHWGRVMHICISNLTTIVSDNCLAPGWCQAIIRTNDAILLIRALGTNFSEILIEFHTFSFKKMHLQMSSAKSRPFCLSPNELRIWKMKLNTPEKTVIVIVIVIVIISSHSIDNVGQVGPQLPCRRIWTALVLQCRTLI